jgi:ABC-type sugar transport system substrate-binding protein
MDAQLETYVEGTIDAVYAENEHLAQVALEALSALGRTDMEVFCVPAGALSAQRGMYQKWTFPVAMGADLVIVGEGSARALAELMKGGAPNVSSFLPVKWIPDETIPTP